MTDAYWIWTTRARDENDARIHGCPRVVRDLGLDFGSGARIGVQVPLIEIHQDEKAQGRLTDNLIAPGAGGALVLSGALRRILTKEGVDNIDYYKCRIVNDVTGKVNEDYEVANVIGAIRCVDYGLSKLTLDESGGIDFIDKLVLKEGAIRGARMFRLADYLPLVMVDKRLKEAVAQAGMTGIKFYRPEDLVL